ncbi:hypothetical protein ACTZFP_09175, partial [Escherichia coli]|uniref:hypothetical protein n=1 Tax=Escherichia coli TaxID=562 RepID=UPI0040685857
AIQPEMTDNVIVGHAGCGVNALSGLQILKHSISCNACCRPDKRSASGNNTFVTQPLDHISSGTYKPDR